jgi:hypothetical protein
VFWGCNNPVSSRAGGVPDGKGVVRVAVEAEGGGARTAIPAVSFDRYDYLFAKDGGAAAAVTPVAGVFELDPGQYTVTVKAYVPGGADPAAQGTSAAFSIVAGADAGAVTVTLVPVVAEGTGTLSFTLTYPDGAELEALTLTRLAGAETIDLTEGVTVETGAEGNIFSGAKTGIGSGYWLARAP